MKITAKDLFELELIDQVIKEPLGGAHSNHDEAAQNVHDALIPVLDELKNIPVEELIPKRHERYLKIGQWEKAKT